MEFSLKVSALIRRFKFQVLVPKKKKWFFRQKYPHKKSSYYEAKSESFIMSSECFCYSFKEANFSKVLTMLQFSEMSRNSFAYRYIQLNIMIFELYWKWNFITSRKFVIAVSVWLVYHVILTRVG